MSANTAANTNVALSTKCGPLLWQTPVRWADSVVQEAQQAETDVQARIQTELQAAKASGGLIPLADSEIQTLKQTLERYGADVEGIVKSADADVGIAATEGVSLLTGLDNDVRALISFFTGVSSEVPNSATQLTPIIAGLQAIDLVLQGLIGVFGAVKNITSATTTTVTSLAAGSSSTTQKNVAQVISDVNSGLKAAVAGGILPAKQATATQTLLNNGFQVASLEANLASKVLQPMTVNVAASRARPTQVAAPTTAPLILTMSR